MKPLPSLALILVVSGLLSAVFLMNVPPGYGPDEPSHFGYVRHLAEGRGFPVLGKTNDLSGPTYESHQPPLYYLVGVPFYRIGFAVGGESGAWKALRILSLFCGLGTVALVFLWMRPLFPEEPILAVGAGIFAGWLPSQASLFGVVSNDPMTELGFALSLYLLTRYLLGGRKGGWHPLWIGLAVGATFLAKYSGLTLAVVAGLALLLAPSGGSPVKMKPRGRDAALYVAGLLVCAPWILRNQALYGDPLGWHAFVNYFISVRHSPSPRTLAPSGAGYSPARYWLDTVLPWGYRDSLGMWLFQPPGHPRPQRVSFASLPYAYALWGVLWLASITGWSLFLKAEWKRRAPEWKACLLASLATLALLFAAYLRLNAVFFWAQSRYVFPAVNALALLWSVGLSRLAPARWREAWMWVIGAALALLSLYAGYSLLGGYFDSVLG